MNLSPLRLFSREHRASKLDENSPLYQLYAELGTSSSGVTVTPETALTSVAVVGCLIVRAETFASLPADVLRKKGDTREHVDGHPAAEVLTRRWNDLLTAPEGWRWKQLTEDLHGNAYVRIDGLRETGRIRALWPMTGTPPRIMLVDGESFYRYHGDEFTPAGDYPAREILHFKGPVMSSPYEGRSLVSLARETIGLSIATEQFYARLLANGAHFPKHLETDKALQQPEVDALQKRMEKWRGLAGAGIMRIFDRGLKVRQVEMSIKDAELTSEQRWLLEQICRLFRVPKSLVQDWAQNTYTNAEQADLWFAKHTIAPICVNAERVLNTRLFTPRERDLYVKFALDGLLRGDFKTRAEGYRVLIDCGAFNPNQVRALEDDDPYPGGDLYRFPLNTAAIKPDGTFVNPGQGDARAALKPVVDRTIEVVRIRAEQDRERGRDRERTVEFAQEAFGPIVQAYAHIGEMFDLEDAITEALGDTGPTMVGEGST